MTEFRNDLLMRVFDQIAFLTARLAGLKAMGLMDQAFRDLENLEQEAGKLDPADHEKVQASLADLRTTVERSDHS